ncbi:hypothetical protein CGZ94_04875 [Enemella evansiae]|uniref:XRE family transcriptional regulator n=1 Tax=Enemella evansiae TaxID=2016499 RepID=A0A255GNY0_9ACTN|nr:hypothetical protein [Enemella evansiae]OYO16276.1 hypothetical protein CGZ94_04875 [Enemella evansiae]
MNYTDEISEAVREWMARERLNQRQAAAAVGLRRPTFLARLSGDAAWKANELPILARAGVDLPAPEVVR